MREIKYYLNKYKKILVIALVLLVLIITLFFKILNLRASTKVDEEVMQTINENKFEETSNELANIKVDIKGYVNNPGVYELKEKSRVIDAINMAGGLLEEANTEYINLSKILKDEMIIIIYSNEEIDKFKYQDEEVIEIKYICECPDNLNDACISKDDIVNEKEENNENDNKISINSATKEELMKIKGIGESKADSIIEYREKNGEFKDIEEIKQIKGIGESLYSKIKDYIKL